MFILYLSIQFVLLYWLIEKEKKEEDPDELNLMSDEEMEEEKSEEEKTEMETEETEKVQNSAKNLGLCIWHLVCLAYISNVWYIKKT